MSMTMFWTEQAARDVYRSVSQFFFRNELRQTAEEILALVRALAEITFDEQFDDDAEAARRLRTVLPAQWHDLLTAAGQATAVDEEGELAEELRKHLHPEQVRAFAEAALEACCRECGLFA